MLNIQRFVPFVAIILLLCSSLAEASLSVHPSTLRDTINAGGKRTLTFHITNRGPASSLGYTVSENSDWVSVSPTSGQLAVGETAFVAVTIDAATLPGGTSTTSLTVGDPHHGGISIPLDVVVQGATGVPNGEDYPRPFAYSLGQNYPNPFNPSTRIEYTIPARQFVTMTVFNLLGQEISTLVNGERDAGTYSVEWNAAAFADGIYFYQIRTKSGTATRRMVLAK